MRMSRIFVFVLICWTLVCNCIGTDTCMMFKLNTNNLNKKLTEHGILEPKVRDHHDCARQCFYYKMCKSIDFHKDGLYCKLNSAESISVGEADFEIQAGAIFSDIIDWPSTMAGKCAHRPCSENQRCIHNKDSFICININCGRFPPIENGEAILSYPGKMSYQDAANVTCSAGYQVEKPLIKCQLSSEWETASCVKRVCNSLPPVPNGVSTLDNENQMSYQDTATVNCDAGYQTDKDSIQCQASAEWESSTCEKIECGNLSPITNGAATLERDNQQSYLDTATVTCDFGYQTDKSKIKCQASGEWELSTCEEQDCGNLSPIPNGAVTLDNANQQSYLDTASVTCDDGYQTDKSSIQCQDSGQWETSTCEKKVCGGLPPIPNGGAELDTTDKMSYLDTATVSCATGYQTDKPSIMCQADTLWEPSTCEKIVCGSLPPIPNGGAELDSADKMSYLDTATVSCATGYQTDKPSIMCQADTFWEPSTCEKIVCGSLPPIPNGGTELDSVDKMSYLDTATVSCDTGYQTDKPSIMCQADTKWEPSTCEKIVCGSLAPVPNGGAELDIADKMSYLDTATVSCDTGYQTDKSSIKCQADTNWESSTCEKIVCGTLSPIPNGDAVLTNIDKMSYLDTAAVSCDPGYQTDTPSIMCQANGQWETPICEKIVCGTLPSIPNGGATLDNIDKMSYLDTATVSCDTGYQTDTPDIMCQADGEWEPSTCESIVCGYPPYIANGEALPDNVDQMSYMDTATVLCNQGYGTDYPVIECLASGYWESSTCENTGYSDCKEIAENVPTATSGTYDIQLWQSGEMLTVYCDMDTDGGGWTVFQNRFDGSVPFFNYFNDYEYGFGDINGEFWLGLKYLSEMVAIGPSELRIDVTSLHGSTGYTTFQDFSISPGPSYSLHISLGVGSIGDSTADGLSFNNNAAFTTRDRDMDGIAGNCATNNEGAWWFSSCMYVHLNGKYCTPGTTNCGYHGMIYYKFLGLESLLKSSMMFRRV